MTLGDMSNLWLVTLQQPQASFTVGGGGAPTWGSIPNPQFGQGYCEFTINQGYLELMGEIEDLELALVSFTMLSTVRTFKYAVPPNGYAPISHVAHFFYQPVGLPYIWELRNGSYFVSWMEFQKKTGQGYLAPYAFGTQPGYATIDPTLKNIYIYPGSANAGDTMTVEYSPLPSAGATGCPTLVAPGDTPILPIDCHMAIVYWALGAAFMRAREMAASKFYNNEDPRNPGLYQMEVKKIRSKYVKKFHGDTIRVEPFADDLSTSRFS